MNYLLTPTDELELISFLREEVGAHMILSELAPNGQASIASERIHTLPDLPGPAKYGCTSIRCFRFWLRDCGPIRTHRDAPRPIDPKDRVARYLTKEATGDAYDGVIDFTRTPSLFFSRTTQMNSRRLAPGRFGAMPVKAKNLPADVKKKHATVERWLRTRGRKTDPFAHCPEVADRRPERLGVLWVSVQPNATKLVENGMEIWPWNA